MDNVMIISEEQVKEKIHEAINIMKHIDINDAPILAAALAIKNDGILTFDKHFNQQKTVPVRTVDELKEHI